MNSSTKILTVSYGTFSCTLEGFDDPLGSMREIAEYFRDLTADDRYFGAEPPTPDVELLQNMAQKEVQRRVDARVTDTGIALVAAEKADVAASPAAPQSGPLTFDDDYLLSDEPDDVLAVDPAAGSSESGPAESVAEKLRRIRAVVSKSIEEEDSSFRAAQARDADAKKNERANSETLRSIEDDLLDDDTSHEADQLGGDDIKVENIFDTDDPVEAKASPVIDADVKIDLEEDVEKPSRSVTDVVESITGRLEQAEKQAKRTDPASTAKSLGTPKPDEDMGRLLDEADTKLSEDGSVRRREVISRMRAAVTATQAERAVSKPLSKAEQDEAAKSPYREVLSDAVKTSEMPTKRLEDVGETVREEDPKKRPDIPPLVLVSSQRTDLDNDDEEDEEKTRSFTAFVRSVGAQELPELLEAAAAYTVFEEGNSSFTRPEIMKRVARVDPTVKLSREESLRSFGQLLRLGKFVKLERGQFTIDEDTPYNVKPASNGG